MASDLNRTTAARGAPVSRRGRGKLLAGRLRGDGEEVLGQFDDVVRIDAEGIEHEPLPADPVRAQALLGVQRGDLLGEQAEGDEFAVWRFPPGVPMRLELNS